MLRRTRHAAALGLSLTLHGAVVGLAVALLAPRVPPKKTPLPLELVEAPPPPPPPRAPPAGPPEPERLVAPPPPRPRPRPRPKPRTEPVLVDAGVPDAPAAEADAAAVEIADGGPEDAGPPDDAAPSDAAELVASAGGAGGPDAALAPPGTPVDPGVIDLRPFVPPGEKVILVLRTDRLRDTPWASRLDAILAPMPDYRLLIAASGLDVVQTFDVVVIASSAPRDVTATFLAGRTSQDRAVLRRLLDQRDPGAEAIRQRLRDPRQLVLPLSKWFVLVRPELLPEDTRPPWLETLGRVETQTGDGPTLAVVTIADLGEELILPVPGVAPLPAPERLTMAVHFDERGLILTGAAVFPGDADAAAFEAALDRTRRELLGSLTRRIVLRSLYAEGAVVRLQTSRQGGFVTFSTSLSNGDALLLLEQAALMAKQYFERPR